MLNSFKNSFISNIKNIPGWRTNRKIVVIECDDWGGIRMPSKHINESLLKKGLNISNDRFDRFDTLENCEDLEMLFELLYSVRDMNNNPAVMTPLTIVANPDFEKIKSKEFKDYFFEPFTRTLNRYYPDQKVFELWKEGIHKGIFMPELHGRDHLTVQLWMKLLREGNRDLLIAFNNGFTSLDIPGVPAPANSFRAEYFFNDEEQKDFLKDSIRDSVRIFYDVFGYRPSIFVPGNGIFHPDFDIVVEQEGIKFLNVFHKMPYPAGGNELRYRRFVSGQKGPGKLTYYTRNCAFEPSSTWYDGTDATLKQVSAAFRWGKPANISTHRVNFAGGIDPANRGKGLTELKSLLKAIVRIWPDVEFMSSADALETMSSRY